MKTPHWTVVAILAAVSVGVIVVARVASSPAGALSDGLETASRSAQTGSDAPLRAAFAAGDARAAVAYLRSIGAPRSVVVAVAEGMTLEKLRKGSAGRVSAPKGSSGGAPAADLQTERLRELKEILGPDYGTVL